MKKSGAPTKYPGVSRIAHKTYRIRGKVTDPRTGKPKEVDRIVENVTELQAANLRAELLDELRTTTQPTDRKRLRVGEYAQLWIKSKALKIGRLTTARYAAHLDKRILPVLGDYYYDSLTGRDVQNWIDDSLRSGFTTPSNKRKSYRVKTVLTWYRVFRNMTRDAVCDLELERDPTMRISFPEELESEADLVPKSLSSVEMTAFLAQMRQRYPQHYALTVVLMYTGLRFCHASALKWTDWDEHTNVIRVLRSHQRGIVSPVKRKKRAPYEFPIHPELAAVLREHRDQQSSADNPEGWMFPTARGTLRTQGNLAKAWRRCAKAAGITRRFTIHGARYTFTDLTRQAEIDVVTRRGLVGHVTEQMQDHYSYVALDEKRAAMVRVYELAPLTAGHSGGDLGGESAGHPDDLSVN